MKHLQFLRYDVRRSPCRQCPFLASNNSSTYAPNLPRYADEIEFACHMSAIRSIACAGALIYNERLDRDSYARTWRLYDPTLLDLDADIMIKGEQTK